MIPGMNLLAQAMTLIAPQTATYFRDAGRTTNAIGYDVTAFEAGVVDATGSVQAVPLTRYEHMGLDYQKRYVTWFVSQDLVGVDRDRSGDQFEYNGRRFGIVSETPWFSQDGWVQLLGVDIGPAIVPEG